MIYIWYNPDTKCYYLGSLQEFKDLSKTCSLKEELSLLYKFKSQKDRLAQKILTQLNAGTEEEDNQEDENTFYRVY
ncbi:MAG: hypothetical protein WBA74_25570 [Cyclobacteriaceae bacterium]